MKKKQSYMIYTVLVALAAGIVVIVGWGVTAQQDGQFKTDDNLATRQQKENPEMFEVETVHKAISVDISGRIRAQNRQELFPEVAGRVIFSDKPFDEGVYFNKGDTLVALDSEELRLQLQSSRSGFQTLVASLLPDIRLDYPDYLEEFEHWFGTIDPEKPLPGIPEIDHTSLRQFVASEGLFEKYYQIKSSEHRREKFVIKAPFSGRVSGAMVEPGQNISPQQHIGTFVDTSRYILTSSVRHTNVEHFRVGQTVKVHDQFGDREWDATISRINPVVSPETQQVEVYLKVAGEELREGMFLEGTLVARDSLEAARIPKTALHRTGYVISLQGRALQTLPVEIHDVEREYVWVQGLRSGQRIIRNIEEDLRRRLAAPERGS